MARASVLILTLVLSCAVASAQTVSDTLTFLMTNQSVSTGDVALDRSAAIAASAAVSRALLENLATIPVATSSSGFVYHLNPELGTVERVSQTFGPFFVERALTAGHGQASFGVTFQQLDFRSLDGRNLRDGSLVTTANQFVDESSPFDADRLALDISARIATVYGNVGITDRFEVGVAVPMVDLTLDGSRVNTYRGHAFTQATASARAIGLADIVARTKYTVFNEDGAAVAAAVDVRFPTGRQDDLLGVGTASVKLGAIGSLEQGRAAAHLNAGVTLGGLAREIDYGAAVGLAATPRTTISGEVLGRWINGIGQLVPVTAPNPTLQQVDTIRLTSDASSVNMITFVPGIKWNVSSTWVLAANVAVPLTSGGLTTKVTPFVGLDYALGR
jgi:hypothetical protein